MDEKKLHRDCEAHTADNCDINDHDNLEPVVDDCGHTVNAGPAFDKELNNTITRVNDYGKDAIVAGEK